MVGAQYVLSLEKYDASTGNAKPKIHSAGLMADYNLSKRTDVYVQAAYQHIAGDKTNSILDNAFIPVPTRRRRRRTRWPCASRCATSSDVTRFSVLRDTRAGLPRCLCPPASASLPAGFHGSSQRATDRCRRHW